MTSNQSTAGHSRRMWAKWAVRRPTPSPRSGCPRRGGIEGCQQKDEVKVPTGHGPWACGTSEENSAFLLGGRIAEVLFVILHLFFEVFPRRFPGRAHQRNTAFPFCLAVVLRRALAAASLSFTVVLAVARMIPGL